MMRILKKIIKVQIQNIYQNLKKNMALNYGSWLQMKEYSFLMSFINFLQMKFYQ